MILGCVCALLPADALAGAQGNAPATDALRQSSNVTIVGPPPPTAPAVVARDEAGRVTVRAERVVTPLRIDGRLDEGVYASVPPVSGFLQIEPHEGAPATQQTEFWVLFDRENVYFSARVWEASLDRMIATEMRHDAVTTLSQNEIVTVAFDTFYDRRNGYSFSINPIGGRAEGQFSNERQYAGDWNGIWTASVGRFDGGWTVEMAIPFKSLRYRPGIDQVWSLQVMRTNRWKNEISLLTPMPAERGPSGFMQMSLAATLVGIEAPPPGRNIEIKPYAVSELTTDRSVSPAISNALQGDVGLDMKYGVRQSLVLDLTYNPDFAQVEADEQQVNLTRFSLFFPEKRDFFLENQGTFLFGGVAATSGGDVPTLFYSRRIGLDGTREVPLRAGARLTGRIGQYSVGLMDIQAKDAALPGTAATNFSTIRIKRDILRRSSFGILATNRSVAQSGKGSNQTVGADAAFAFLTSLSLNTYWARTRTPGLDGDDTSYRAQLDYSGDRYGVQAEHLHVGNDFNPEVGFRRRNDIHKSYGQVRFSPRPRQPSAVRKYTAVAAANYIENSAGRVDLRDLSGDVTIEFQSSDRITAGFSSDHEYLPASFEIAPGVKVLSGGYDYHWARAGFNFGQQRRIYGNASVERGTLYGGDRTTFALRAGRVKVSPQFSIEPTFSINRVDLPQASFQTNLVGSRITYTMTPLMFVTALSQYSSSSHSLATNVRFRWEYRPGSELFVVYNDQRDTLGRAFPDLVNRALIVKITGLLRF
jgi:hypothetical protein